MSSNKLRCEKPGCRTLVTGGGLCSKHDGSAEARERRLAQVRAEAAEMIEEAKSEVRALRAARHAILRGSLYRMGRADGRQPVLREDAANETR